MANKEWTKDSIKQLLMDSDKAVMRGIVAIYNRQTDLEQSCETTHDINGVGFNGPDAPFLSSLAKQILGKGYLTERQLEIARKKMLKYSKQLTEIANA